MNVEEIIRKKRDGFELDTQEINFIVRGITTGDIPDYQISAWAMAVFFQGMNERETIDLTLAMSSSGDILDLSEIEGIAVDKHSSGGVGDKTTLVAVPLVAAAGLYVAKMSGRGLGHTGGTIDKLESIPGFMVEKNKDEFIKQINQVNAAIVAQSGNLVPADKKLYALRDVTATVDSLPLIAASIMSKKLAAGAAGIVLDVKVGRGAFMQNETDATRLAELMVKIGTGAGRKVIAVISDMSQPLGRMTGNSLEVKEALDILKGKGDERLTQLCLNLVAYMLIAGKMYKDFESAWQKTQEIYASGAGLNKFAEIITAQGGVIDWNDDYYGLPQAEIKEIYLAGESGYIQNIDALEVGKAAMVLGAGRAQLGNKIDYSAGVELLKKPGDYLNRGEACAILHTNNWGKISMAHHFLQGAFRIGDKKPTLNPLIIKIIK